MISRLGLRVAGCFGLVLLASMAMAQKDGTSVAMPGETAPAMAKDGVPAVVKIRPGSFVMGADDKVLPASVTKTFGVMGPRPERGDFDETPAHRVTISKPFAIGVHKVTPEEYRQFDPKYVPNPGTPAYASGISWDQAEAYCAWLTKKTGKPWRLPTEAEWEYVARAGGKELYGADSTMPKPGVPNAFGVADMAVGRPEWVQDWYGPYQPGAQVDPVGPASGYTKVVRGGGLDYRRTGGNGSPDLNVPAMAPFYSRAANRASMAPAYASNNGNIGFRIVQAGPVTTKPLPEKKFFFQTAVKQTGLLGGAKVGGPDLSKPWYHERELFPNLQGKSMPQVGWKLGLERGLGIKYHNSAIQFLPNGDVLAAFYNHLEKEDDPDQSVITMRRRAGSEEWDMPEPWPDFADASDAAPVIWNDKGKVWMFFGFPRLIGAGPFAYMTSTDNGVTWSPVKFPYFPNKIGRYVSQPINSAMRAADGTIYMPTDSTGRDADGNGSISVVWGTKDEGKTWFDTGGRTAGRHTTVVIAKNGNLLGYGGKNSQIDGRMPMATSADGGKTWVKSKTPFDILRSGERPSIIRLASGRLFFVSDYNPTNKKNGHTDGSFVALSDDDGATWVMKRLPENILTVGYVTATQAPDGIIHIATTKNKPDYEIELNEAWVLAKDAGKPAPAEVTVTGVKQYAERYRNGKLRASWGAGRASDGRVLLQGAEKFFYPNGKLMRSVTYEAGKKVGEERYLRADGTRVWVKTYAKDGSWTWQSFDHKDKQTAESKWQGKTLASSDVPEPPAEQKAAQATKPEAK